MNIRLSDLGPLWTAMLDGLADFQSDNPRRLAAQMGDALDREAQRAVEGVSEWRNPVNVRSFPT